MKKLFLLITASVLSGCVTQGGNNVFPIAQELAVTPVCKTDKQCQAMWLEAKTRISKVTGMRLRIVNDDYLETYALRRYPTILAGTVTKSPNPDGSYSIKANIVCTVMDCRGEDIAAFSEFNTAVIDAGKPYEYVEPVKNKKTTKKKKQ